MLILRNIVSVNTKRKSVYLAREEKSLRFAFIYLNLLTDK